MHNVIDLRYLLLPSSPEKFRVRWPLTFYFSCSEPTVIIRDAESTVKQWSYSLRIISLCRRNQTFVTYHGASLSCGDSMYSISLVSKTLWSFSIVTHTQESQNIQYSIKAWRFLGLSRYCALAISIGAAGIFSSNIFIRSASGSLLLLL